MNNIKKFLFIIFIVISSFILTLSLYIFFHYDPWYTMHSAISSPRIILYDYQGHLLSSYRNYFNNHYNLSNYK